MLILDIDTTECACLIRGMVEVGVFGWAAGETTPRLLRASNGLSPYRHVDDFPVNIISMGLLSAPGGRPAKQHSIH